MRLVTRYPLTIVAVAILTSCVDKKPEAVDTATPPANAPVVNETIDSVRLDTTTVNPAPDKISPPPPVSRETRPPVTGETRHEPPVSRDPMPPLRGETSKGPQMPVYRDSTRGPLNEIDSKGQPRPIKRL